MNQKYNLSALAVFDMVDHLEDDAAIAEYLNLALEENDPALLAVALSDISRARGMSEVSKRSGITREALYKALRPNSQPRFETINRVCHALGMKLVAQPLS